MSGLDDFNGFVALIVTEPQSPFELGVGPLFVVPTATDERLGAGKYQLGGTLVALLKTGPLLAGTLVQYQASVAGAEDRENTSVLAPQLLLIVQAGGGVYLRSTPVATFDLKNREYDVPISAGIGKVVKIGSASLNIFIEPQYAFLVRGAGRPLFQIYSGINTQFSL